MYRSGREAGFFAALLMILVSMLLAIGCGATWFNGTFDKHPDSMESMLRAERKSATKVAVNVLCDDPTFAAQVRHAVYLEMVQRKDHYSVQIEHETEPEGVEADIVLRGLFRKHYPGGLRGGFSEFTQGGTEPDHDGSFSLLFEIHRVSDGKTIWQYFVADAGFVTDSPERLRETVGRKVAAHFPFRK